MKLHAISQLKEEVASLREPQKSKMMRRINEIEEKTSKISEILKTHNESPIRLSPVEQLKIKILEDSIQQTYEFCLAILEKEKEQGALKPF